MLMKNGQLVPVEVTLELLHAAMVEAVQHKNPRGFLVDGFPREISQATAFKSKLRDCDFVIYFKVILFDSS